MLSSDFIILEPRSPKQDGASILEGAPAVPAPAAPLLCSLEPGAGGGGIASPPPLPPLPLPGLPPGPDPGPQPLPLPPLLCHHYQETPGLSSQGAGARNREGGTRVS